MVSRRKKIWIITLSVVFALLVVLPGVALGIIKWYILPSEKLTPLVLNQINPLVNGRVSVERIELSFRSTFPRVGLNLVGGEIISYACRDSLSLAEGTAAMSDTLVTFSRATVSIDVMDYLKRDRITVDRLTIEDPFFYGLVDEQGSTNWDILIDTGGDHKEDEPDDDSSIPVIDLQRVRIRNGHFIYEDRPGDIYTEIAGFELGMRNKMSKGNLNVDVKTGFKSLIFDSPAYVLENDLSLGFESKVDLYRDRIEFSGAKLTLNRLPFTADGRVDIAGENLILDIGFGMLVENLADLLAFVPEDYFTSKKKITTQGSLSLEGKITGMLGDSSAPDLSFRCLLDKGALKMKGSTHGIDRLDTDIDIYLNGNHPDSSWLVFRKLDMDGSNTSFRAKGNVSQLMTNPYVDAQLKGKIDFGSLFQDIMNPDTFTVRGMLDADIEAGFRLWELADGDFSRLNAAGKFDIDRMVVADRVAGMSVFARGVSFTADTTRQESSYLTNDDLVSARLTVDTMSLRYGEEINSRMGNVDVQLKTSRTIDTTTVVPVTTHIRVGTMRTRMPDSVWVSAHKIYVRGGIKASDSDRKKGVFGGQITVDTIKYFDVATRTRLMLDDNTFNIQIMPIRDAMRRQRALAGARTGDAPADSAARASRPAREPGSLRNRSEDTSRAGRSRGDGTSPPGGPEADSIRGPGRGREAAPPVENNDGYLGMLRNWEVKGSLNFASMRGFTGMFPLPVRMENTKLSFDTDKVTLSNARMRLGNSDLLLNGEVNSMRRAILQGGTFKANLSLDSEYIDCNQLMRAINRSMLFAENETVTVADEEGQVEQWEQETQIAQADLTDEDGGLFLVPANVDLVIRTNARKVDFEDVQLENINGEIVVRNQSVNLRRLKMDSNVGSGNVTMVYTARDRDKATAAFELELDNIIVEHLISMFPAIDSLLPMLRSFEGVLDCQMTAVCELDSMMNVVLPSLHTACYLSGENMVLMDGETFAEISKKLMFKNKDRNLIDYVSVDLLIKDNKVEIYPFLVELDRYKLAVGGIHNLDMTFDYHVSVLKSPVPFKLGIDVKGNLDDFKFKIVKCRYKELFKVAREAELENTRLNLRASIRESIAAHLMANAPELGAGYTQQRVRSRRPDAPVTDMDEDQEPDEDTLAEIEADGTAPETEDASGGEIPSPEGVNETESIDRLPESAAAENGESPQSEVEN